MRRKILAFVLVAFVLIAPPAAHGQLQLPSFFTSGAVLQRDLALPIWGTAASGAEVTVTLNGFSETTQAATDGAWRVDLQAMSAGGPYIMTVTTETEAITLTDVYVGDVWLASGQSNMEWTVSQLPIASDVIAAANDQQIRQFKVQRLLDDTPASALPVGSSWTPATSSFVGNFTAVGYFFASHRRAHVDVPIGIINASYGGSRIETWMSEEMLGYDEQDVSLANGEAWMQPTVAYNAMIHPLLPFPIKGFLWYQGESNTWSMEDAVAYGPQFQTLIQGWRDLWAHGDLPFFWVQLPNFGPPPGPTPSPGDTWPPFRASQESALALPNTGQAVTIDVGGEDIHPPDKEPVGYRLSLVARTVVDGEDIIDSGPHYRGNSLGEGGRVTISYDHVGGGLVAGATGMVGGFAIAGRNGIFVRADAAIEGDQVVVWSTAVPEPVTVRYAWENNPVDANLYNSEELPAAPFEALVYPGFKIAWFNALRTTVEQGQSTTLSWEVYGASSVMLDGVMVDSFATTIITPDETTTYSLLVINSEDPNVTDTATITIDVLDPLMIDRTRGRPAKASTFEMCCGVSRTANLAVDGDPETRWSSAWSDGSNNTNIDPNLDDDPDEEWIMVDLGSPVDIERVVLSWETAYASAYDVEVSFDGYLWTSVYSKVDGNGGEEDIVFGSPAIGRYIRVHCKERATASGYSLFEIEAYGTLSTLQPPTVTIGSTAGNVVTASATVTLLANTTDADGSITQATFYVDGEVLITDDTAPFESSWTPPTPGAFVVTAIVTDNSDFSVQSAPVEMHVVEAGSMTWYEAERAITTGASNTRISGAASGRQFLELFDAWTITWPEVSVPVASDYLLGIRYQLPFSSPKLQYLVVNGDTLEVIEFNAPDATSWLQYGVRIPLESGTNEIAVHGFWNWMSFDYIAVSNEAVGVAREGVTSALPSRITLAQNYPNPFARTTVIEYALSQTQHVKLEMYDMIGQRIAMLVDEVQSVGNYQVSFVARDLASGVYMYRLQVGEAVHTKQMLLIR